MRQISNLIPSFPLGNLLCNLVEEFLIFFIKTTSVPRNKLHRGAYENDGNLWLLS